MKFWTALALIGLLTIAIIHRENEMPAPAPVMPPVEQEAEIEKPVPQPTHIYSEKEPVEEPEATVQVPLAPPAAPEVEIPKWIAKSPYADEDEIIRMREKADMTIERPILVLTYGIAPMKFERRDWDMTGFVASDER